ncbi:hypothetical protein GCM10022268_17870 [Sphingomonas cynarae]|uniref:Uncharacterized protein n=1 Tax=Sphingomonas cynarae TaxID=930197 RepID=A0ABP7DRQ4_9SPHN
MDDPVEDGLARLAIMAVPPALDRLEANVFAAIDDDARHRASSRTIGLWSVGAALALGLIGGTGLGGGMARAAGPIGIDDALAPSTLLLGQ